LSGLGGREEIAKLYDREEERWRWTYKETSEGWV
jgi:hypothetical protein